MNTVAVRDIGSASASVAFFRSMGGAAGVAVLGAILGTQVENRTTEGLATAVLPAGGGAAGGSLNLVDLPAPVADVVRAAYGDSTALIFQITAVIAVLGLVCVLFIREAPLRRTVDVVRPAQASPAQASPAQASPTPTGPVAAAPTAPGAPANALTAPGSTTAVSPAHVSTAPVPPVLSEIPGATTAGRP